MTDKLNVLIYSGAPPHPQDEPENVYTDKNGNDKDPERLLNPSDTVYTLSVACSPPTMP